MNPTRIPFLLALLMLPACLQRAVSVEIGDPELNDTASPDDTAGDEGEGPGHFLNKPDINWGGWNPGEGDDTGETDTGEAPDERTMTDGEWWNLVEIDDSTARLMPYLSISDCEDAAPYHDFDWGGSGDYDYSLSQIECIGVGFKFTTDDSFDDRGTVDVAFTSLALDTDDSTWVTITTEIPVYWSWRALDESDEGVPIYELSQAHTYRGDEVPADTVVSEWVDIQLVDGMENVYLVETEAEESYQAQDFIVF